ncbi:diacylglycerol/lipid kinase family protein [Desertihabitans brevis]|uniref:diacylglycerol/lipid kinase family protein n=1 Tax=Desertihabitans brevis TaxID=2268447 RepID=UPI0018F3D112|nr:diacylglycerol kinase family protein [Desertihabitans brevis]
MADVEESFDRVVLVFNPVNRRVPRTIAEGLQEELRVRRPALPVTLVPTTHAGHARELAAAEAEVGRPLVVAVSGDGVFSEVVNGVMEVADRRPGTSRQAVAAVVAGGNANDHRRSTRRMSTVDAVANGRTRRLDLLRLTVTTDVGVTTRYAHSYVGLGLTPLMAIGLNRASRGTWKELLAVVRTVGTLAPVEVVTADDEVLCLDSLVLANVERMAKYGRVSRSGQPDDGLFEVLAWPHRRRWRLGLTAVRAATVGLGHQTRTRRYAFRTTSDLPAQVDGELVALPAGAQVTVECAHHALLTIG